MSRETEYKRAREKSERIKQEAYAAANQLADDELTPPMPRCGESPSTRRQGLPVTAPISPHPTPEPGCTPRLSSDTPTAWQRWPDISDKPTAVREIPMPIMP
jgi:hypothetical protein